MKYGALKVVCGPMFSGKTEEVQRLVRRASVANKLIRVLVPEFDNRYGAGVIKSHAQRVLQFEAYIYAVNVDNPTDWETLVYNADLIVFDEVQFFSRQIVSFVKKCLQKGVDVVVAGLDLDFQGMPFGALPELMAQADEVIKLKAVCSICGADANRTYRLTKEKELIKLGAEDAYQARCAPCWEQKDVMQEKYGVEQVKCPTCGLENIPRNPTKIYCKKCKREYCVNEKEEVTNDHKMAKY